MIRRRFLDIADRQLHYREGGAPGAEPPLVLLPLLPGSSQQLVGLMNDLLPRHVVAPDLPGTGDSDQVEASEPTIADLAHDIAALIDHLGAPVDLYGTHTGAAVAIELAARHRGKVRRLIIDGVPLFDAATAAEMARTYAPVITPDHDGTHLLRAHGFCRDQFLFFPWHDRSASAARGAGLPPADALFAFVRDVLKALPTIPGLYRAAFTYPAAERLAQVTQPTLCLAPSGDTLAEPTRRALALLADGRLAEVEGSESDRRATAAAIRTFLETTA